MGSSSAVGDLQYKSTLDPAATLMELGAGLLLDGPHAILLKQSHQYEPIQEANRRTWHHQNRWRIGQRCYLHLKRSRDGSTVQICIAPMAR